MIRPTANRLLVARDGEILARTIIRTGRDFGARRTTTAIARAASQPGTVVAVETARGWLPRTIVERGGRFYTREVQR